MIELDRRFAARRSYKPTPSSARSSCGRSFCGESRSSPPAWATRSAHRLVALRRHAAHQRVFDAQRASVLLSSTSNAIPTSEQLMDDFHVAAEEIPVVICRGTAVLKNPANREMASCLGFNEAIDSEARSRPRRRRRRAAGLAAAVYGASEGLDVLSSRRARPAVRPHRARESKTISAFRPASRARSLPARAYTQAEKFGAQLLVHRHAFALRTQTVRVETAIAARPFRPAQRRHRDRRAIPQASGVRT